MTKANGRGGACLHFPLPPPPTAPAGISFLALLGARCMLGKGGHAQRHKALTVEPQAPVAGEQVSNSGSRGTAWHPSRPEKATL